MLPVTPDVSEVIQAAAVKAASDKLFKFLLSKLSNFAGSTADQIAVNFRSGFQHYLERSYVRCKYFKSMLAPHEPLELISHYVNVCLKRGAGLSLEDVNLIERIEEFRCVVVTGLAGSGKSMFMRYVTIWHFENTRQVTPIYVELRHLNNLTDKNLLSMIRNSCVSKDHVVSESQFNLALKAGAFILVLDGFDEINYDRRDVVERQILDLQRDFPALTILLSSRPDGRFGAWASFHVFEVESLTKKQVARLIETLPYDESIKKRFLDQVNGHLYNSHQSFLSSPLLATMMLLTFESYAEIPSKMHAFYGRAFDTLFQKHDADKDQYVRKVYCGLQLEDFRSCFAAFCALSYLQEKLSFDAEELRNTATRALSYADQMGKEIAKPRRKPRQPADTKSVSQKRAENVLTKQIAPEQFTKDLLESVCMIRPDGLEFSFVHRSFQEYFAARFVTGLHSSKIAGVLNKYCLRLNDSVLPMLFDMYRGPVEQEWVLPTIEKLRHDLKIGPGADSTAQSFMTIISSVGIRPDPRRPIIGYSGLNMPVFAPLLTVCRMYPEKLGNNFIFNETDGIGEQVIKENILKESHILQHNFDLFKRMFVRQKAGAKQLAADDWVTIDLTIADGWWLELIGVGKMLANLEKKLDLISKEIVGRSKLRDDILSDLL